MKAVIAELRGKKALKYDYISFLNETIFYWPEKKMFLEENKQNIGYLFHMILEF